MNWIPVAERLPEIRSNRFSDEVLVERKYGDHFVARLSRYQYHDGEVKYNWYSYGTGGRRMCMKGTVVAWSEIESYQK